MFLEGNGFPERWQQQDVWTIAETGFGTGLNFLCCWEEWLRNSPKSGQLTFVSSEKHPLTRDELRSTLAQWAELERLTAELIEQWPERIGGFHSLSLSGGRVTLLLLFGDSAHAFSQLDAPIDAWFLDGFTPSRNPDMWQRELIEQIGRLSHRGTTVATFTAAGFVRRGLIDVGFAMSKRQGYRHKRDMLIGTFKAGVAAEPRKPKTVAVIGGGLAGCSAAYSLARRGMTVVLYEAGADLAGAASSIPAAVTRPFPDQSISPASRLSIDGFAYTQQLLRRFGLANPEGAIWANQEDWPDLPAELAIPSTENAACSSKGLLFPNAQTSDVAALCRALVDHPNIRCHFNNSVTEIIQEDDMWHVVAGNKAEPYSDVIVCSGAATALITARNGQLSSRPVRGQLSGYETELSPEHIICGNGHIKRHNGRTWAGASFVPDDTATEVRERDREVYETKVSELTGGWSEAIYSQPRVDWVGIRSTTADHLPLAGQLVCNDKLKARYTNDRPRKGLDLAPDLRLNGLFVSLAHGSRGTVTAPICGELIAAAICGDACPVPIPVRRAIDPARQAVKRLRQMP